MPTAAESSLGIVSNQKIAKQHLPGISAWLLMLQNQSKNPG
jgi:hypothetical protein